MQKVRHSHPLVLLNPEYGLLVGDFGLATSSLAAVDPSDVSQVKFNDAELTLGKPISCILFASLSLNSVLRRRDKTLYRSRGTVVKGRPSQPLESRYVQSWCKSISTIHDLC